MSRPGAVLLTLTATLLACKSPPVYEKEGGSSEDFYVAKRICLDYASQPQVYPYTTRYDTGTPGETNVASHRVRLQVDQALFDDCMRHQGWLRVE